MKYRNKGQKASDILCSSKPLVPTIMLQELTLNTNNRNIGIINHVLRVFLMYFQLMELNSFNVSGDFSNISGCMKRA